MAPTTQIFMKYDKWRSVEERQVTLKSDKNDKYFTSRYMNILWQYLTEFFSESEMVQTKSKHTFYVQ